MYKRNKRLSGPANSTVLDSPYAAIDRSTFQPEYHFKAPISLSLSPHHTSEERPPVNNSHFYWAPRVVVVHRFDFI
jgi:hypothetical protein